MKFTLCMDDSELIRNSIKDSVTGKHDWGCGGRFVEALHYVLSNGQHVNVLHMEGTVFNYLKYKFECIKRGCPDGCIRGWMI